MWYNVLLLATLVAIHSVDSEQPSSVNVVVHKMAATSLRFRSVCEEVEEDIHKVLINDTVVNLYLGKIRLSHTCLPSSRHLNTYNVANKPQVIIDLMRLSS